ncbi:MAG TPA: AAA family ATPase [Candidatus Binatia bacterium]|nr:AAA family ATPase [Candidatus Binatia bacterium]
MPAGWPARSAGAGEARSPLRVHVLGGLSVEGLAEPALGSRKARLALRMLAVAGGSPVPVDRLVEALWPDRRPRDPAAQVAVLMSRLRGVLGPDRIHRGDGGYSLDCDWLDLTSLEELAGEAGQRLGAGSPATALSAAVAARSLLPPQPLDSEALSADERPSMERVQARVHRLVAEAALAAGDLAMGIEAAHVLLDIEPYDEEALRLAMAGLSASGRASSALALHERVRLRLAEDLGASPSPETDAAHRAVLKGLPVPGIAVGRLPEKPGERALVGRDEEMAALDGLFSSAASGGPEVVAVVGEPGAGKTALITAWLDRLGPATPVLWTRCEQVTRTLPLQPVLGLVRSALRRAGPQARSRLLGGDRQILTPLLEPEARGTVPEPDWSLDSASSPAGVAMLCAALRRVVCRVFARPGVVFIDDIHRADGLTLAWIADLAAAGPLPLLVVVTHRAGESVGIGATSTLRLGPLSIADAVVLAGARRAEELHRRSGGNPLFLTLLARSEEGDLLPETVQSAVLARCAEAPEAAGVLHSAAALGMDVDVDLLAAVLRTDPIRLLDHLDRGVRLGLLDDRGGSYAFRHAIVREALEGATKSTRRALLHREAVRALVARQGADPFAIAHHARLSGARALESMALTAASRMAAERFDYGTALALSDEAIAAEDTPAARTQRAIVHLRQARYAEARADAEEAAHRGADPHAWEVAGAIAYYCRDFPAAQAFGEAVCENARDPRQRAQGLVIRGRALHAAGELAAAEESLEAAMELCRQRGLRRPAPIYGFLKVHTGDPLRAIRAISASPDASAEALSTIYTPVHADLAMGYALATCGRAGDALRVLGRAAEEASRRGLIRYMSLAANLRAWVHRNCEERALADEGNRTARAGASASEYRECEVYAVLDLAEAAVREGDVAAARRCLDEAAALMLIPYAYDWRHRLRLQVIEARLALLEGGAEPALRKAEELIRGAERYLAPRYRWLGEALQLRAEAALDGHGADEPRLRRLSDGLALVAGMEAWWVMAELAAGLASPLCWSLAEAQRVRLAASLEGEARERFVRQSGARLERMSTLGVSG